MDRPRHLDLAVFGLFLISLINCLLLAKIAFGTTNVEPGMVWIGNNSAAPVAVRVIQDDTLRVKIER